MLLGCNTMLKKTNTILKLSMITPSLPTSKFDDFYSIKATSHPIQRHPLNLT
jgi:hypothetical protein